jgi:hypothetical protein
VTPQFGASLTDDSRVIIYDHNMFIIQAYLSILDKPKKYLYFEYRQTDVVIQLEMASEKELGLVFFG